MARNEAAQCFACEEEPRTGSTDHISCVKSFNSRAFQLNDFGRHLGVWFCFSRKRLPAIISYPLEYDHKASVDGSISAMLQMMDLSATLRRLGL